MPSNDARNLLPIAVPPVAVGAVAVAVRAVVAAGMGAMGATVGPLLAGRFWGLGL